MTPRPYQRIAHANIDTEFLSQLSTLLVMATGLGKTVVFAEVIKALVARGVRVMVTAHREELVEQAADKIRKITGITPAIEMAERKQASRSGENPQIVCASVMSLVNRLDKFVPNAFGLYVRDEAHGAVTATDTKILDHFHHRGGALHLGVTATPKRSDKVAMGRVYASVAYEFDIADAIPEGWLVPIQQEVIETSLDFSAIRTTAGDLNQGDLNEVMIDRRALLEIALPTLDIAGDRQSLTFCVTVQHAHLVAMVMRENTKAVVAVVDGKTPKDERRAIMDAYRAGQIQHLVNVGIATEGFDNPPTAVIANARVTKSELLYRQCCGRGTRALDGVVDRYAEDSAEMRRQAIADSGKPYATLIDFVGNAGRHSLCSAADLLSGTATDVEKKVAKSILDREDVKDVVEAFRLAKERISAAEMARMRDEVRRNAHRVRVNPFMAFGVSGEADPYGKEITPKQLAVLERAQIPNPDKLDKTQATRLIGSMIKRREHSLCTYKQADVLLKRGLDPAKVWQLQFQQASGLIDALAKNKWKPPSGWATDLRVAESGL